jgi:hypothetical protein
VLLGNPPIDWSKITNRTDCSPWRPAAQRPSSVGDPDAGAGKRPPGVICYGLAAFLGYSGTVAAVLLSVAGFPIIGTFVADGDHGALVTTPVDVNAAFLSSGAVAIEVLPKGIRITP